MEKINVFDVQVPDGRQIRCMSYNKVTYFDLDDICKLCFDSYDLHDVADTKVMSEFLHREDEHAAYIAGFAGHCVGEFINNKDMD